MEKALQLWEKKENIPFSPPSFPHIPVAVPTRDGSPPSAKAIVTPT